MGILKVIPGTYIYIGSAFGPGGLKSRISHHRKPSTVKHWHIDYIKPALHLEQIWYTCNLESEEHNWARMIGSLNHAEIPLAGFGSSDCQCPSHLYYFPQRPCFQEFQAQLEKYLGKKPNLQLEQS
ncbi:MAG: GIY-YIG nuclease family protein [Omnitrophica WOR_2 bacterium]